MNHGQMKAEAVAYRLIDESAQGETSGEAISEALGLSAEGRMPLYHALFAAKDEGLLGCDFPGGMELPYRVRR